MSSCNDKLHQTTEIKLYLRNKALSVVTQNCKCKGLHYTNLRYWHFLIAAQLCYIFCHELPELYSFVSDVLKPGLAKRLNDDSGNVLLDVNFHRYQSIQDWTHDAFWKEMKNIVQSILHTTEQVMIVQR
jgi:hypothetical protein